MNYQEIGELDKTHPYSLFTKNHVDEKDGLSNYYVEIKSSLKPDETTALLWMLDTHDFGCDEIEESWGCIR